MISAFGVDHGDQFSKAVRKVPRDGDGDGYVNDGPHQYKLSPTMKAGLLGGAIGATVLSRKQAGRLGMFTARRTVGRGDWAMERAGEMRSATGARARRRYATGLQNSGVRMSRSDDTREITGRAAAAGATGAVTATVSHLNRRSKETQ